MKEWVWACKNYKRRFAGMPQKNSLLSFSKFTVKSMKHKQEQESWDLGNREIANNQQLLSSHDLFNFVKILLKPIFKNIC